MGICCMTPFLMRKPQQRTRKEKAGDPTSHGSSLSLIIAYFIVSIFISRDEQFTDRHSLESKASPVTHRGQAPYLAPLLSYRTFQVFST